MGNRPFDTSRLMITARLLAEEAVRKGYSLLAMSSRPSAGSYTIYCQKNGKAFYFKSLCTALTPSYAVYIAEDKVLTKSVLEDAGVRMPDTIVAQVNDPDKVIISDTMRAMLQKHGRLVVKPVMTNHGNGVTVDVRDEKGLIRALKFAYEAGNECPDIIVQQMVFGQEYRFLVLGNKVLAVAYRRPPFVVGDGVSTIRELIEKKNSDPRRGDGHAAVLTKISLDEVSNGNPEGFLDTVPLRDDEMEVLRTSNLSRGGEAIDVTDAVSPELKKLAVRAAQACSLGVAGIDIVTGDISGGESDSYVLEVNVSPGIRMHQYPSVGKPRDVAKKLFRAIEKTAHPTGKKMEVIGRVEKVGLPELLDEKFRARIDTGATVSSLWVSDIRADDKGLHCKIFGEGHPLFSGEEVHFSEYSMRSVRSSNGHEDLRYQVTTTVRVKGKKIRAKITLADRSRQLYPMLIGRNILRNKFVVHVADGNIDRKKEAARIHYGGAK